MDNKIIPAFDTALTTNGLVPEEQALDGVKAPLVVYNPLAEILTDMDLEAEAEDYLSAEYAEAKRRGFFSPLIGMARLPNIDGEYYAQICLDEKQRKRIEFCQRYETGEVSPKIEIRQSDFIRALQCRFGEEIPSDKRTQKAVEDFKFNLSSECLDKFDGMMSFDVVNILQAIASCYRELPIHRDINKEDPADFYRRIMDLLGQKSEYDDDSGVLYGHTGYYPFTYSDMKWIADSLEMTVNALLRKLKGYHFLYLTDSSVGYQTNVRLKTLQEGEYITYTQRRYCLLRLKSLENHQ